VSTLDQNTARQLDGTAVDKTFTDKASGKDVNRAGLGPVGTPGEQLCDRGGPARDNAGVDYDLNRLGSREFEHLIQALALKHLGNGIQVFGDGPDGGREAVFDGPLNFPVGTGDATWRGYGVIQAKHRMRPEGPGRDADWLINELNKEFKYWRRDDSERRKRGRLPEYFLLVSNVRLSPVVGAGGIDRVQDALKKFAVEFGIKGWYVWHADQISRMLDDSPDIRRTYGGFLTSGDILTSLAEVLDVTSTEVGLKLRVHAAQELMAEQWVRLGESGFEDDSKLQLAAVSVDLPAWLSVDLESEPPRRSEDTNVLEYLIAAGDHVLRPTRRVRATEQPVDPMAVVLIGGPGHGKSTLAQLLCQVYRLALLDTDQAGSLGAPADRALRTWRTGITVMGLPVPKNRRWPIHIDLSKYADEIIGGEDVSLISYLAQRISRRGADMTANELAGWLPKWPWLLVLDGLDEVPAVHTRTHLLRQLNDFITDASVRGADLLVVATTRPQGYQGEFGDLEPAQLTLRPLPTHEALEYANRVIGVRHAEDPDLAEAIREKLADAAKNELTARLMRSPLQVTIMTSLLERQARVPQTMHALFDAYFDTIYSREIGKSGHIGRLLETHRSDIHYIHEQVGLRLQIQAERDGHAKALMDQTEFSELVAQRLRDEGQDGETAQRLARDLSKAATDRLVLLTPNRAGFVGFEIRSLQEYMAARALTTGDGAPILERLRHIAPSAHWRNTWLLAAGRIYDVQQHLRPGVADLLRQLDEHDYVGMLVNPGARLAIDLLDDDLGMTARTSRRSLAVHALTLTQQWPGGELARLAETLSRVCHDDEQARHLVVRTLGDQLGTEGRAAVSARLVLVAWASGTGPLSAAARQKLASTSAPIPDPQSPQRRYERVDVILRPLIDSTALSETEATALEQMLRKLARYKVHDGREASFVPIFRPHPLPFVAARGRNEAITDDLDAVYDALQHPAVAEALALATDALSTNQVQAGAFVRELLSHWLERRQVGDSLIQPPSTPAA
jgi:hypothetical protein